MAKRTRKRCATLSGPELSIAGTYQTFKIPGRLPSLNEILGSRNHWTERRLRADAAAIVRRAAQKANLLPMKGLVEITYHFTEKNKRRDKSNIEGAAAKIIPDVLVSMGVLVDDSWDYVEHGKHKFFVDKEEQWIVVILAIKLPDSTNV